jgi:hypothetical protein
LYRRSTVAFTLASTAGHIAASLAVMVAAVALFLVVPWSMKIAKQVDLILRLSTKRIPFVTRVLRIVCVMLFVVGVINLVAAIVKA